MKARLYHNYSKDSGFISSAICVGERGVFSHVSLGFECDAAAMREMIATCKAGFACPMPMPDSARHDRPDLFVYRTYIKFAERLAELKPDSDGMFRWYAESIGESDEFGGAGVHGPIPQSKVESWATEDPKRRFQRVYLSPSPTTVTDAFQRVVWCVGADIGYAYFQLGFNLGGYRFGLGIPRFFRSPLKMTCCEFAARCGPDEYAVRVIKIGQVLYDETAPSSKSVGGMFEAASQYATWLSPSL